MKEEENVYKENEGTEETTAVSEQEKASAVPDKFKDVDALAKAYSSLQAEFTRRSQRLKELEKMAENFEKGEPRGARSGAEKLRKNASARKAETKQFDEFMQESVKVKAQETEENASNATPEILDGEPSKETPIETELEGNGATVYEMNASTAETELAKKGGADLEKIEKKEEGTRAFVAGSANAADSSESLYLQVSQNEKVRLKIIGEYLSSIGRSGAPLMTGGVGTLATPPIKPKSISEAGNMALLYFKKPRN